MSQEPQIPSENERKAFVEKLGQFRSSLQPSEQRMLDSMAIAAFGGGEQADVQGYQWFYGGPAAVPAFYTAGYRTDWFATPWGVRYRTVPVGVYGTTFLP
jgi:hypothetical protein